MKNEQNRLLLFIVGVFILISSVAVRANPDGTKLTFPKQYSEKKIDSSVIIEWDSPDEKYGAVDHYLIGIRGFRPKSNVEVSDSEDFVLRDKNPSSKRVYKISGTDLGILYDNNFLKYRISICAVMKDGTKRWSDYRYFYIASHNTPIDKPISFHIYNGFSDDSKEQTYYACQNWNNNLNIGREIVNTYPYEMGTNLTAKDVYDGINIVSKNPTDTATQMATFYRISETCQLMEADIIVNTNYAWANSSQIGKFNFYNVITHEIGHIVGLTDKYDSWAKSWTMYGIIDPVEDKKITLEPQDILNGRSLYK